MKEAISHKNTFQYNKGHNGQYLLDIDTNYKIENVERYHYVKLLTLSNLKPDI